MEKKAMKAVNREEGITITFNLIIGCQLEKYLEEQNKRKTDKKQKEKEKKGVHNGDVEGLLGGESILKDGSKR